MDAAKKQRKIRPMAFTKAFNSVILKIQSDCERDEKIIAFPFLEMKMTDLEDIHSIYNKGFFESNMSEADINKELESDDTYKTFISKDEDGAVNNAN